MKAAIRKVILNVSIYKVPNIVFRETLAPVTFSIGIGYSVFDIKPLLVIVTRFIVIDTLSLFFENFSVFEFPTIENIDFIIFF